MVVVLMVAALVGSGPTAAASPQAYAPLDAPGPELSVPVAALHAALTCDRPTMSGVERNPVLLVHGTNLTAEGNFSWNYARDFAARGWAHCLLDLPGYGLEDIQVAGEYVVYALRRLAAESGRRVDVVGYSQGGMLPRWALRFWPDTRALVENLVGLAPSNHGTVLAHVTCSGDCHPAHHQQAASARFIEALNSGTETFAGIDYTVVYTRYDEIVVPNLDDSGASSLRTGDGTIANIALQDVCPTNTAEHLAIGSYDAVAHALVVDALTHAGPADPARIDLATCATPFQPGVDPATFAVDYARYLAVIAESWDAVEQIPEEPPLACYVTASCVAGSPVTEGAGDHAAGPQGPQPIGQLPATGWRGAATTTALALGLLGLALLPAGRGRRRSSPGGMRHRHPSEVDRTVK